MLPIGRSHFLSKLFAVSVLLLFVLILAAGSLAKVSAASSAKIYFRGPSSIGADQSFVVELRLDSGSQAMTAVEAYGKYDNSRLRLNDIDYSGSGFDLDVEDGWGDGAFNMVRVAVNDVAGDVLLAKLKFTALTTGDANLSFENRTKLSDPNGQLFEIASAPSVLKIVESSTQNNQPVANTVQSGALSMTVSPLYIGYTSVNFLVNTSQETTVSLSWGDNSESLDYLVNSGVKSKTHLLTIDESLVSPATQYHYAVTATAESGGTVSTTPETFKTLGLVLNLQILDPNDAGVKSTVELEDGRKFETDQYGFIAIDGLSTGLLGLKVKADWRTSDHEILISDSLVIGSLVEKDDFSIVQQQAQAQNEVIELDYTPFVFNATNIVKLIIGAVVFLVSILVLIKLFVIVKYRRQEAKSIQAREPEIVLPEDRNNSYR